MNNNCNLVIKNGVACNCEAMEANTISKNCRSFKNHSNSGNFLKRGISPFLFYLFIVIGTFNNSHAQSFDCKKDRLHAGVVQFSPDLSSLILGQNCQISIFKTNGKKVDNVKDFSITSDNRNVRVSGLTFLVDNNARGEPWLYVDGNLIEEGGNITISINKCNQSYTFPFEVRQSYVFDKEISCKGDNRKFAIAPYKNFTNKNLYVVLDISRNQLHLLEAPISIDASGVHGTQGIAGNPGTAGKAGDKGTEKSPNGGSGTNGGNGSDGGDGTDGGNGGEIIVYMSKNTPNVVSVNVEGGEGGRGGAAGAGGKGGKGGSPYQVQTGTKKILGISVPIYEDRGNKGTDGRDGIAGKPGKDGRQGKKGNYTFTVVGNINKYFENIQHSHFKIENIVE